MDERHSGHAAIAIGLASMHRMDIGTRLSCVRPLLRRLKLRRQAEQTQTMSEQLQRVLLHDDLRGKCLRRYDGALGGTHNAEGAKLASGWAEGCYVMTQRYDLTDLRLFLHVADASNITHGALRANMTLASASERIRAMELDLGTSLLVRKRRGVELTPAGTALLHHARIVTQQLEHMRGELNDYAKGLRAQVHVRSNTMGISTFLPARLARFLSAHPNIDVDLEEGRSHDIVRAVAAGKVEIGIVAEGLEAASELETMPVGEYRFVLVVPLRHELARRRKIPFKEVLDYDLVGLRADTAWQSFLNEQATRVGKRSKLRVRLDGFDSICRVVENRIGLAVVPEQIARRWTQKLRVIPLDETWALRHLTLCVRKLASLPPHARSLVTYLTEPASLQKAGLRKRTPSNRKPKIRQS